MKKITITILLFALSLCLIPTKGNSCTSFCLIDKDRPVIGKNYDWSIENGLLIVNKRGVQKTAAQYQGTEYGQPVKWKSRFGSITFNQFGREMPMGGINEAGLVVEVLMLTGTVYPEPDSRPSISVLQWVQYQLDNFSTTKEVIESDSHVRILQTFSSPGMHYFICDKEGRSASIEFLDGKLICHTGNEMPARVLTNTTYADGVRSWYHQKTIKTNDYVRAGRFVYTAELLEQYEGNKSGDPMEYALDILASVSQGSFTKWSIVYDIQGLTIYFRTFSNSKIRQIALQDFDFSCKSPVLVLGINNDVAGDAAESFVEYKQEHNRLLAENIFRSVSLDQVVREDVLRWIVAYPDEISCENN